MPQPTLRTRRLTLVPLTDEHVDLEAELDADPEVMRYLQGRARTYEEVVAHHPSRMARAVRGLGFWMAFAEGAFVGWWVLCEPSRPDQGPVEGQAEVGWRLLRRWWRQGLASEGARELLRYAFDDLGLERVFAETMAVNAGSRGVMRAVGMAHVRTFQLEWDDPLPGVEHGEVEYALTCAEWRTGASPPVSPSA